MTLPTSVPNVLSNRMSPLTIMSKVECEQVHSWSVAAEQKRKV